VAFGRPKGYRGSYRQWAEGDTAPLVVIEILSPSNIVGEMTNLVRSSLLRPPGLAPGGRRVDEPPDRRPLRAVGAESARADAERERAERLAARLRALGVDPEGD
jgi:hypothetical protein